MKEVILKCPKCKIEGVPDTKEVVFKNNTKHTEARCSRCGTYIKYLPHNEPENTILYFGKYKGKTLEEIALFDENYLRWLYDVSTKPNLRDKIDEVLSNLNKK